LSSSVAPGPYAPGVSSEPWFEISRPTVYPVRPHSNQLVTQILTIILQDASGVNELFAKNLHTTCDWKTKYNFRSETEFLPQETETRPREIDEGAKNKQEQKEMNQAWNSEASGKRRLHLARANPEEFFDLRLFRQLRDMASSLTSR